jgi:hypothetical protein
MHLSLSVRAFIIITSIYFNLHGVVFSQTATSSDKSQRASISGRVIIGGQPAVGKKVLIADLDTGWGPTTVGSGDGTQGRKYYSVVTDTEGKYWLTGLPAGKYEVSVNLLRGYVPAGQQGLRSTKITLKEAQEARNIDFTLVRGGVINGRLTDADGNVIIGALVHAISIDEERSRNLEWALLHSGEGMTDDRGVYRIYGLPAGGYRVSADGTKSGPNGGSLSDSGRIYPRTFHPNVAEEAKAAVVEVREGNEVLGIDIDLGKKKILYEVTGLVIDSITGEPLSHGQINCFRIGPDGYHSEPFPVSAAVDSNGNFRIAGLASGRYGIGYSSASKSDTEKYYKDDTIVEVRDKKLSGVKVEAKRAAAIKGSVIFAASSNPALADSLSDAHISAINTREEDGKTIMKTFGSSQIASDDSFRLTGLEPGRIKLEISGNPRPRLLRIEKDGVKIPNTFTLKSGETIEKIRLVVAYDKGVVRGQLSVEGHALPEGMKFEVSIYRLPAFEYYGRTGVSIKGRFVFDGLMDGSYTIEAFGAYYAAAGNEPAREEGPTYRTRQIIRVTGGRETLVNLNAKKMRAR